MNIENLKNKILSEIDSFDIFLRNNFDFDNVACLHDNKIDYNNNINFHLEDNFISITLHNCCEIQDYILISVINDDKYDKYDKEYIWNGVTFYAFQFTDEMD